MSIGLISDSTSEFGLSPVLFALLADRDVARRFRDNPEKVLEDFGIDVKLLNLNEIELSALKTLAELALSATGCSKCKLALGTIARCKDINVLIADPNHSKEQELTRVTDTINSTNPYVTKEWVTTTIKAVADAKGGCMQALPKLCRC
jgi:hypothetical protein